MGKKKGISSVVVGVILAAILSVVGFLALELVDVRDNQVAGAAYIERIKQLEKDVADHEDRLRLAEVCD